MKPNLWIFSIEPIESRYTKQWHQYFPEYLAKHLGNKFNIVQVDGIQKHTEPTPGAFLNFSDTNYWKSSQLCNFLDHYNNKETTPTDQFIFTDAWNSTVLQLKYMSELLGLSWKFHGLFHAGSWDQHDFLGRLIGDAPWVRNTERALFESFDYNYFATHFHIDMFKDNLFPEQSISKHKIVRTGWPMEYLPNVLEPYTHATKRNLILFPHRIAPEKQVEIFRELAIMLPEYEFVVCQDQKLSKHEYHTLLSEAKIVFSASLQETLGISWYEGALVKALPMVPNRLSYSEMALPEFTYPSNWTESAEHFNQHKSKVAEHIRFLIENYETLLPQLNEQVVKLQEQFFECKNLLKILEK